MGQEERYFYSWPPVGAPLNVQREDHWRQFDNSVNAVSFGFVATAILISMFLVMAIFERFLRPNSSPGGRNHGDLESQLSFNRKLSHPSPKVSHPLVFPSGISSILFKVFFSFEFDCLAWDYGVKSGYFALHGYCCLIRGYKEKNSFSFDSLGGLFSYWKT